RRLSGGDRLCSAAHEHVRSAGRHENPARSVRPQERSVPMSAAERYTATRTSIRTASIMVLFTVVFTTLMSGTYWLTRPAIEASQLQERMRLINELLPASAYNNALLEDFVELGPTPELGLD